MCAEAGGLSLAVQLVGCHAIILNLDLTTQELMKEDLCDSQKSISAMSSEFSCRLLPLSMQGGCLLFLTTWRR